MAEQTQFRRIIRDEMQKQGFDPRNTVIDIEDSPISADRKAELDSDEKLTEKKVSIGYNDKPLFSLVFNEQAREEDIRDQFKQNLEEELKKNKGLAALQKLTSVGDPKEPQLKKADLSKKKEKNPANIYAPVPPQASADIIPPPIADNGPNLTQPNTGAQSPNSVGSITNYSNSLNTNNSYLYKAMHAEKNLIDSLSKSSLHLSVEEQRRINQEKAAAEARLEKMYVLMRKTERSDAQVVLEQFNNSPVKQGNWTGQSRVVKNPNGRELATLSREERNGQYVYNSLPKVKSGQAVDILLDIHDQHGNRIESAEAGYASIHYNYQGKPISSHFGGPLYVKNDKGEDVHIDPRKLASMDQAQIKAEYGSSPIFMKVNEKELNPDGKEYYLGITPSQYAELNSEIAQNRSQAQSIDYKWTHDFKEEFQGYRPQTDMNIPIMQAQAVYVSPVYNNLQGMSYITPMQVRQNSVNIADQRLSRSRDGKDVFTLGQNSNGELTAEANGRKPVSYGNAMPMEAGQNPMVTVIEISSNSRGTSIKINGQEVVQNNRNSIIHINLGQINGTPAVSVGNAPAKSYPASINANTQARTQASSIPAKKPAVPLQTEDPTTKVKPIIKEEAVKPTSSSIRQNSNLTNQGNQKPIQPVGAVQQSKINVETAKSDSIQNPDFKDLMTQLAEEITYLDKSITKSANQDQKKALDELRKITLESIFLADKPAEFAMKFSSVQDKAKDFKDTISQIPKGQTDLKQKMDALSSSIDQKIIEAQKSWQKQHEMAQIKGSDSISTGSHRDAEKFSDSKMPSFDENGNIIKSAQMQQEEQLKLAKESDSSELKSTVLTSNFDKIPSINSNAARIHKDASKMQTKVEEYLENSKKSDVEQQTVQSTGKETSTTKLPIRQLNDISQAVSYLGTQAKEYKKAIEAKDQKAQAQLRGAISSTLKRIDVHMQYISTSDEKISQTLNAFKTNKGNVELPSASNSSKTSTEFIKAHQENSQEYNEQFSKQIDAFISDKSTVDLTDIAYRLKKDGPEAYLANPNKPEVPQGIVNKIKYYGSKIVDYASTPFKNLFNASKEQSSTTEQKQHTILSSTTDSTKAAPPKQKIHDHPAQVETQVPQSHENSKPKTISSTKSPDPTPTLPKDTSKRLDQSNQGGRVRK